MTDKERLGEVKSEPFANLEKLKVDILQEKICSGLEDFEQDSKRQWTSLRFEKPLLVKLLSLIKQAERVQELEDTVKHAMKAIDNTEAVRVKLINAEQQNKRYKQALEYIRRAIYTQHCTKNHKWNTEFEKGEISGLIQASNIVDKAIRKVEGEE